MPRESENPIKQSTNSSLDKAFRIIEYLCSTNLPQSAGEISKAFGFNRATTSSLLSTMLAHEYVTKSPAGKYQLSSKLFELGSTYYNNNPIVHALVQQDFFQTHNYDCALGVTILASPYRGVLLCVQNNMKYFKVIPLSGSSAPLHATGAGKMLLSHTSQEYRDAFFREMTLYPYTEHTITTRDALEKELSDIRQQGFARDKAENRLNLWCYSAPIYGPGKKLLAAISLTGEEGYMKENEHQFISDIKLLGARISLNMGGGSTALEELSL